MISFIHSISKVFPLSIPDSTEAPEPKIKQKRTLSEERLIVCASCLDVIILDFGKSKTITTF
jgi:hypothetical protein